MNILLTIYLVSVVVALGWAIYDCYDHYKLGVDIKLVDAIGYLSVVLTPVLNTLTLIGCIINTFKENPTLIKGKQKP